ncbi:MAG TPA: hypothetical protein PKW42_11110, partial [bacterium]|nr:hypothetical protein [bacterium]
MGKANVSVCLFFFLLFTLDIISGFEVKYEDLQGTRRKTAKAWEVGFGGENCWPKIKPLVAEIEGMAYFQEGKPGQSELK